MDVSADISLQNGDVGQRERARLRLYVLFQSAGWGSVLAAVTWMQLTFPEHDTTRSRLFSICYLVIWASIGFLLSHLLRRILSRYGWKQLGWRALLPRILSASMATSVVWCALLYSWTMGVMREPLPGNTSIPSLFLICVINYAVPIGGWLCLYYFYHLFDRLNRSEIERFQLMTSVKEAELRALKSQVNPHFIFNSLNSLRALVDEDPARARNAVTQLANLLRYSLQSGQLETVPFEDELEVVNDYLALEQVRLEERLRLRMDIAPGALRLAIPPMLLQTLVENAVKYGIAPRSEGGEISIVARNEAGALRITVSNPGTLSEGKRPTSTGMGLNNAAERLRLIFGERATLRIRSEAPEVVVAEAVIPLPSAA